MPGAYPAANQSMNEANTNDEEESFWHADPTNAFTTIDEPELPQQSQANNAIRSATNTEFSHAQGNSASQPLGAKISLHADDDPFAGHQIPTKIAKASRACDECRRRKSKCTDGNPETGQACAPCRARGGTDAECHYNRTPMKRGPSKGYIQAMKGNVDDVSRGQRRVLSHVDYLKVELETVKDQLSKLVNFVTHKFGPDALEPPLSREEIIKRVRISNVVVPYVETLSLDGQKALHTYEAKFQSVLPFIPEDASLRQSLLTGAAEPVRLAFEFALRAIDTPIYSSEGFLDQKRADLIQKANSNLGEELYTPLYMATLGILMLAIQTTGPVSGYQGKLPKMLQLQERALDVHSTLRPFGETIPRSVELENYLRNIELGIRSLLMITSVGTGEIFGLIDSIPSCSIEDQGRLAVEAFSFAKLADTYSEVLKAGISMLPINYHDLKLAERDLPQPGYMIVSHTLKLLITRLNASASLDVQGIIRDLGELIDHLYESGDQIPEFLAPTCWLYYHGLALAVKTATDLWYSDDHSGQIQPKDAADGFLNRLSHLISQVDLEKVTGWEQAAGHILQKHGSWTKDHSTSPEQWRKVLVEDAYLRALDY